MTEHARVPAPIGAVVRALAELRCATEATRATLLTAMGWPIVKTGIATVLPLEIHPSPPAPQRPPLVPPPIVDRRPLPSTLTTLATAQPEQPDWLKDAQPLPLPDPARAVPLFAKPIEPLFSPAITRAILTRLAAASVPLGEVDVRRLAEIVAEGRPLATIPRRCILTLAKGLDLLIDSARGMDPFVNDIAGLVDDLADAVGRDRLRVRIFRGDPGQGVMDPATAAVEAYRPPAAGTPVLAVTDLGIAARRAHGIPISEDAWLGVARELRSRGSPLAVLTPYARASVSPALRRGLHLITWDRRTGARLTDRPRTGAAAARDGKGSERLARLASVAGRIDPQFLRALRLHLAADLGTEAEADLWFSERVQSAAVTGAVLWPEQQRTLQDELAAAGDDLLTRAWELLFRLRTDRAWADRDQVAECSWLVAQEELTYWALKGLGHQGPEREAAEARLKQILKTLITAAGTKLERDAVAWTRSASSRLPPAVARLQPMQHLTLGAALRGADTLTSAQLAEKSAQGGIPGYLLPRSRGFLLTVWIRRVEGGVEAALHPLPRAHRVEVAATGQLHVSVGWSAAGSPRRETIQLNPPRRAFIALEADWVEIAAPDGSRFLIASQPADFAVFRDVDAPWCPELVALPAGAFMMGSPETEDGRYKDESPQHRVTIRYRFAIGRYPVTVGEYQRFVDASDHRHDGGMYVWTGSEWMQGAANSWRDPGFAQTDRHPVVGVSWQDAVAYCEWLGSETGKSYRLPSEAEWEYACCAGTTTRFAFGDMITPKDANYDRNVGKTTEVGAYPPNPWGLYDMHGNVWEWVQDVWHDNYTGAPNDGSAWTDGEGKQSSRSRVNRGGSWLINPWSLRAANRYRGHPDGRFNYQGFRVARTLD